MALPGIISEMRFPLLGEGFPFPTGTALVGNTLLLLSPVALSPADDKKAGVRQDAGTRSQGLFVWNLSP